MKYSDYVALNEYTDIKNYELVIRVFEDNTSFGWYRNADTQQTISDSQFDIGLITFLDAEDHIAEKFNCYHVSRIKGETNV